MVDLPQPVVAHIASPSDESAARALWNLFRHDMSAVTGSLPDQEGRFREERLQAGMTDPAWAVWLLRAGPHPIGLAVVRSLDEPERVLNTFFVVAGARRAGVGLQFALDVMRATPGRWAVAFQDTNEAAVRFWPKVAAALDATWRLEHLAVPNRPELPPDAWVRLTVTPGADSGGR